MGFLVLTWFLCYNKKCLQYEIETIFITFYCLLFLGVSCYGFDWLHVWSRRKGAVSGC